MKIDIDRIKSKIIEHHPIRKKIIREMRNNLNNKENITLLTPNCLGGLLFHDLGIRFNSPMIDLNIYQDDFLKIILNLDFYMQVELEFYDDPSFNCPCAMLEDVRVIFTHYSDKKEAAAKWIERKKRINKENMFIFMTQTEPIDVSTMEQISKLDARGIAILTVDKYDSEFTHQVKKHSNPKCVDNLLIIDKKTGMRKYHNYLDFVAWFNTASGKPYSIKQYVVD